MASTQARGRIIDKMTPAPQSQHAFALAPGALAPIVIADGALEALKWLGIVLMTIDHINKYLNGGHSALMFDLGRIALPLFGFVLAYKPLPAGHPYQRHLQTRQYAPVCLGMHRNHSVRRHPRVQRLRLAAEYLIHAFGQHPGYLAARTTQPQAHDRDLAVVFVRQHAAGILAFWYCLDHCRLVFLQAPARLITGYLDRDPCRIGYHQQELLRIAGDPAGLCSPIRSFASAPQQPCVLPVLSRSPCRHLDHTSLNPLMPKGQK